LSEDSNGAVGFSNVAVAQYTFLFVGGFKWRCGVLKRKITGIDPTIFDYQLLCFYV
jgi:hypothetical protein